MWRAATARRGWASGGVLPQLWGELQYGKGETPAAESKGHPVHISQLGAYILRGEVGPRRVDHQWEYPLLKHVHTL